MESKTLVSKDIKLAQWGDGEWLDEPDMLLWEYKGTKCRIVRIMVWEGHHKDHLSLGHLCGYIEIPEDHPWFEKDSDEIDVVVHGGPTYANLNSNGEFWLGFDCAHSFDITPSLERFLIESRESAPECIKKLTKEMEELHPNCALFRRTYRNIEFVKAECEKLVDQMLEAGKTA